MSDERATYGAELDRRRLRGQTYGRMPLPEELPQNVKRVYESFARGYVVADRMEDIPQDSSPYMVDMEVTDDDRLIRPPGIGVVETFVGRNPDSMVLHAALENTAELVFFAPPELGYKAEGATAWINPGLASVPFAAANYGGVLLFTGRYDKLYARHPRSAAVEVISGGPAGGAITTFAGRILVGDAIIDGNAEPLGIVWNAASGDYKDWSGIGAGFELLAEDMPHGDHVRVLVPIDLDHLAILNRHSIWIGRRTGMVDRPVEFRSRVKGEGIFGRRTARAVPGGVVYLADDGVRLFDINRTVLLSKQINRDLLPLSDADADSYRGGYDPLQKRYYLMTPSRTWVYDFHHDRWYRWDIAMHGVQIFMEQFAQLTWDQLVGNWDDLVGTWEDMLVQQGAAKLHFLKGNQLGQKETSLAVTTWFGANQITAWQSQKSVEHAADEIFYNKLFTIQYAGLGDLTIQTPDMNGVLVDRVTKTLPGVGSPPRSVRIPLPGVAGAGLGMGLKFSPTAILQIVSIVQEAEPGGQKIGML